MLTISKLTHLKTIATFFRRKKHTLPQIDTCQQNTQNHIYFHKKALHNNKTKSHNTQIISQSKVRYSQVNYIK